MKVAGVGKGLSVRSKTSIPSKSRGRVVGTVLVVVVDSS
jgi:hypothetical protein